MEQKGGVGRWLNAERRAVDKAIEVLHGLVAGVLGSAEWAHSSFGRKIEKAVAYRDKGYGVEIISEQRWLAALGLDR